jgi:hypothetical protein
MRNKSTISPPEGHIRRAKLWDYSANTLPWKAFLAYAGIATMSELQLPVQLGRLSNVCTLGWIPYV